MMTVRASGVCTSLEATIQEKDIPTHKGAIFSLINHLNNKSISIEQRCLDFAIFLKMDIFINQFLSMMRYPLDKAPRDYFRKMIQISLPDSMPLYGIYLIHLLKQEKGEFLLKTELENINLREEKYPTLANSLEALRSAFLKDEVITEEMIQKVCCLSPAIVLRAEDQKELNSVQLSIAMEEKEFRKEVENVLQWVNLSPASIQMIMDYISYTDHLNELIEQEKQISKRPGRIEFFKPLSLPPPPLNVDDQKQGDSRRCKYIRSCNNCVVM
jgi:hypothetical protein